ncbi:MAG TPA: hypothetical protein VK466_12515, partial [Terriglobales bacterium]|nr:hypothetical protein [Terriglobales bacterium]
MKIVSANQPVIPTQPDAAKQASSEIGNQTINTAPETTNQKPADKLSVEAARERFVENAVASKANLPAKPLDDPLSKEIMLDRLGCGNSPQ